MRQQNYLLSLLVLTAACGPTQKDFRPAEQATAESPTGYVAAQYRIDLGDRQLGEAKVWSDGAFPPSRSASGFTTVHFGLELENHSGQTLLLDQSMFELDLITSDGMRLGSIEPARMDGSVEVPPHQVGQAHLYFQVSPDIKPGNIGGMRLRWAIRDNGQQYVQHTPFVRERSAAYVSGGVNLYHSPFYDPYLFYHPRYRTILVRRPHQHHIRHRTPPRVQVRDNRSRR